MPDPSVGQSVWWVGFDDERVAKFDDEQAAITFAHIDSQLEGVTVVVLRHDPDGTSTVVYTEVRSITADADGGMDGPDGY